MTPILVIAFCTIALIGSYLPVYEERERDFEFEHEAESVPTK